MRHLCGALLVTLAVACGQGQLLPAPTDGGAGGADAGARDSGSTDAGLLDAGLPDAGQPDAGQPDAGQPDAGPADGGASDAGASDAGNPDAGGTDAGVDAGSPCARCAAWRPVTNAGALASSALTETSGLAASRTNPGVLYGHNDSGGQPSVYVIGAAGAALGELRLTGAQNNDWEDLAVGPCDSGSCIYVGEIGDNGSNSATPYVVYRVEEPVVPAATSIGTLMVAAERFELAYPNNDKHDAEALMVHPATGDLYVVIKTQFGQKSAAFKAAAPLQPMPAINALVKIADLQVPDGLDLPITAADIEPCGQAVLLRSYSALYLFDVPAGGAFDSVFTSPFSRVPSPAFPSGEAQGESVAWAPGGGYYTVSEGLGAQLHRVLCQ